MKSLLFGSLFGVLTHAHVSCVPISWPKDRQARPNIKIPLTSSFGYADNVSSQYVFPETIYNGVQSNPFQYVRDNGNPQYKYDFTPVYQAQMSTVDIRCNAAPVFANDTLLVKAGDTLGFTVRDGIFHNGPLLAYMAKVPGGETAATWDGSGQVVRIDQKWQTLTTC
jgi:plastocyanin